MYIVERELKLSKGYSLPLKDLNEKKQIKVKCIISCMRASIITTRMQTTMLQMDFKRKMKEYRSKGHENQFEHNYSWFQ